MLEVGKAGTAGTEKGVVPVLRDDAVVAPTADVTVIVVGGSS